MHYLSQFTELWKRTSVFDLSLFSTCFQQISAVFASYSPIRRAVFPRHYVMNRPDAIVVHRWSPGGRGRPDFEYAARKMSGDAGSLRHRLWPATAFISNPHSPYISPETTHSPAGTTPTTRRCLDAGATSADAAPASKQRRVHVSTIHSLPYATGAPEPWYATRIVRTGDLL